MNILFIDIDTLRADHLGCYGYHKPTSPRLDRLAAEGALFERCYAPGIPTTPAHATIYTGMHPIRHGIVSHGGAADLDRRIPVLPELLQRAGYTTCAVDNLYDIKPWLTRGYEFYINPSHRHRMRLLVSCEEVNARAIPWLRAHAHERFFLYIHYWEPHTPYMPPKRYQRFYEGDDPCSPVHTSLAPIRQSPIWGMFGDTWFRKLGPITDAAYIEALYDGEIRHADDGVAQILEALDATGVAEDTLVVVTADHGEVMVRGGIFFDHHGLYDEVVRVPLLLRWPGRIPPGIRRDAAVLHSDLAPTLLHWSGATAPDGTDGLNIGPLAEGTSDAPLRDCFAACECTWQAKWMWRRGDLKLILAREPDRYGSPRRELYDLAEDPGEVRNLAEDRAAAAGALEAELEEWIASELQRAGRTEDPLVAQGITLGRRWDEWVERGRSIT
ncbi:MAG TPA: sulfatase [Chthonomonadales bacterium]|nr:sulfatase [Chthonomonadales bacterium]